jgi:hypothetical protein
MSTYAAEPVPADVEAVTASYLDRQFNQIQTAFMSQFVVAPKAGQLPERGIPGAIIYIEDGTDPSKNGFYGCVKNSQGEGEWKKLT